MISFLYQMCLLLFIIYLTCKYHKLLKNHLLKLYLMRTVICIQKLSPQVGLFIVQRRIIIRIKSPKISQVSVYVLRFRCADQLLFKIIWRARKDSNETRCHVEVARRELHTLNAIVIQNGREKQDVQRNEQFVVYNDRVRGR